MGKDLLFTVENNIAIITLNRPDQLNSFSIQMITEWINVLEEIKYRDDINVVIITGAGKAFSTGGDLKAIKYNNGFFMQPDGDSKVPENVGLDNALKRKNSLWKLIQRIPLQIKEIDKPVIAAVNGLAIGAGMDMALACDICFCSDKARFSEGYIKLGLVPGDGGAYFLPRIVGTQKALELLWTGDEIDAEEAYKLGIVSRVFQHEKLMEQTLTFAKKVANANPTAISMIKRSVYQGLNMDLKTALDMISSHMAVITDTDEFKETVRKLKKEM